MIGIVDADFLDKSRNHRFPNLACMKMSGYFKERGGAELVLDWKSVQDGSYDAVYVSKVFTDTKVPKWLSEGGSVHLGGTGFHFDRADPLPDEAHDWLTFDRTRTNMSGITAVIDNLIYC